MRPSKLRLVGLASVVLCVGAGSVSAQVQTGEIFGKVTDSTGAVLPGVTITLESPALITPQSVATAESGAYRFPNIPIGTYTVKFEIAGFKRLIKEGVRVDAGFNAEINARLDLSAVEETITVSGESPIVDTKSTTLGTNFTKELLDSIPSARDPWVILEQTPGMVMDRQNVGGNQSGQQSDFLAHGSSANQQWNIDGATVTDMAANSSPTYYDFDSFEEIQISTGGGDAEQEAAGVRINFVTKSGGNTFKGSSRFFVVDNNLQSDNITDDLRRQGAGAGNPIKNIKDFGYEMGGPVKRNKAWFWGALSRNDIKVGVVNFLKPGATDPNDSDNLETDLTVLENYNGKIQYQWTNGQKSTFLYTRGDKTRNARGAGPLSPLETTVRQTGPTGFYKLDHQWVVTDRLMLEGKGSYLDGGFLLNFHADDLAAVQPIFHVDTQRNERSGSLSDNIRPTTEIRLDGNYFLSSVLGGDHTAKFGVRYRSTPYQTISKRGGGATARFRNGVPAEADIVRDGHTSRDLWEWSAHFSDSYKTGRTTVTAGVRADYQDDEALAARIPANPILPDLLPAVDFKGADSGAKFFDVSPRFGVTYDLRGSGKTVLKANVARYYGIGIYTAATISPTGQTTLRYRWTDLNRDAVVQRHELDLTRLLFNSANYDPRNPSSVTTPATVDPNLENDRTDELIAGIDHELMPNFGVGVSYIWRRYDTFDDTYRVGLASASFIPVVFPANCGNGTCDQPSYTVTYWQLPFQRPAETILRNNEQRRSYQGIEFTARKRFSRRWMMNGSFTWNDTRFHYDGGPDVDFQDPTNVAQQDGRQIGTLNVRWVGKLSGMYALPWGFSAAGFLNTRQGFPFNRTVLSPSRTGGLGDVSVFVKPYASERHPTFTVVDARVDRTFQVGRTRFIGSIDAFNLGNASTVLGRIARQNATNANRVTTVVSGRVIRVGVRLTF